MSFRIRWALTWLALVSSFGLFGCRTPPVSVHEQTVILESNDLPTVLTGFLSGGAVADLLVLDRHNGGRARLMHLNDGEWSWTQELAIPEGIQFVDVLRSGARDRLLVCRRGQVELVDYFEGTFAPVLAAPAMPSPSGANSFPHVDVTRDLNGDSMDDLVIPTEEGVWVALQQMDGVFTEPFILAQPFSSTYLQSSAGYRYLPWEFSRVHVLDYDRDGSNDLVYWNGKEFVVHDLRFGDKMGSVLARFAIETEFDTDDLSWLAAPFGVQRREKDRNPEGSMDGRVLHSIRDMDNDGLPDLVFFSLRGGSIWRLRSVIEIHYGVEGLNGALEFAEECGSRLVVEGIPFRLWLEDLGADRPVDVVLATIRPGVLKVIGLMTQWVFSGRHSMDLQSFRLVDRSFSVRPTASHTIKASSNDSGMVFPSVLIGDLDGDGPRDLLFGLGKTLRFHAGEEDGELFSKRSTKLRVSVPRIEYSWLVDLNRDGKQDVLMHDVRPNESDQLIILLAQ